MITGAQPLDMTYTPERDPMAYPGESAATSALLLRDAYVPLEAVGKARADYYRIAAEDSDAIYLDAFLDQEGYDLLGQRYPVVAFGSNRGLTHLNYRFRALGISGVPVLRGTLVGADVVYPAHISDYGIITSTLAASPGTKTDVSVLFVTRRELQVLHEVEARGRRFAFGTLDECELILESGERLPRPWTYLNLHGCLEVDGAIRRLSAVAAVDPSFSPEDLMSVMDWASAVCAEAGLPVSRREDLVAFGQTSDEAREEVRKVLGRYAVDGNLAFTPLPAEEPVPRETYCHLASNLAPTDHASVRAFATKTGDRPQGNYAVVVSRKTLARVDGPSAWKRWLGADELAVANSFTLGCGDRPLPLVAAARLRIDDSVPNGQVRLDKTIRTALGVRTGEWVVLKPIRFRVREAVLEKVARAFRTQYAHCRVVRGHYPDSEKDVCRVSYEALEVVSVAPGEKIVVQGLHESKGRYEWRSLKLKALATDERILDERASRLRPSFDSYYPDCAKLLGIPRDLYWVMTDVQQREMLLGHTAQCSIVRVRRSTRDALAKESTALVVIAFGGLVSVAPTIDTGDIGGVPTVAVVSALLVLAALMLVLLNVRKQVP